MEQKIFPKIIMHMKQRFQRNENFGISIDEILDELQIYDVPSKTKLNLDTQVLPNNPKLASSVEDNVRKYTFKPYFKIRNKRELVALLKEHQAQGLGGLVLDDIQESMTTDDFDKIFNGKKASDDFVLLTGKGKKKIVFYNDRSAVEGIINVEEEIVKYWRDVAVDGMDDTKIDDYLEKQGIASMKDAFAAAKLAPGALKRKTAAKGRQSKKHNEHLTGLLDEYNPDLVRK